jgi:hypothetical protein
VRGIGTGSKEGQAMKYLQVILIAAVMMVTCWFLGHRSGRLAGYREVMETVRFTIDNVVTNMPDMMLKALLAEAFKRSQNTQVFTLNKPKNTQ